VRWRFVLVVLVAAGCGGDHVPRLRTSVRQVVSQGAPGAFAFVRVGDRTQTAAAGLADVRANIKIDSSDRFRVGSVTKTFVATVVLQLVAERRLGLDDPVSRWVPGLLPDGARITIRDLLSHRSGLADVADDPAVLNGSRSDWSPQRLVALMAKQPRTAAPGAVLRYSSTNYLLLGLIIERVTGRTVGSEST